MRSLSSLSRRHFLAATAAVLGAGLTACSTKNESPKDAGAANDSGEKGASSTSEEHRENLPQRIVALDWRFEEILVALGVTPVGIVEIGKSAAPPTLEGKLDGATSVGQAKQPNLEIIQSLEPDLIIASPTRQGAIMDQLKEIAPTQAYGDSNFNEVLGSMDSVAGLLGKHEEAKDVRQRIEQSLEKARASVKPGTRAVMCGWSKGSLYTWLNESFIGSLLSAVGYEYAFSGEKSAIESKTDVAQLSADELPGMNADVLFLYADTKGFRETPYVDVVPQVVDVEQDVWSRTRGPLAAESILADIVNLNG